MVGRILEEKNGWKNFRRKKMVALFKYVTGINEKKV
jgi:hypothetical protein